MEFSIRDVAKYAGVSKSTVSRVLNGNPVGKASYDKVMKAVNEMGYRPNYLARSLRSGSNTVIGVLSLGGTMFRDVSLCGRFAGVSDVLQQQGYDLLLVHDDYDNFNGIYTPKYITYLAEKRINGLITLGATDNLENQIKHASSMFRNVVYTGDRIQEEKGFRVYLGNYNYSYDLFYHLLEYGHRRILMLYSEENDILLSRRKSALQAACKALSITQENLCDFYNPYRDYNYIIKVTQLQEAIYRNYQTGGYTAIFCDESIDVRLVLTAFAKHGKAPGKDYSIVSIEGGLENSSHGLDSITCVHLPDYEYGQRIAELMIEVIENEALEYKDVYMSYSLTKGNSVKNLFI